jgi:hypothetical protein
MTFPSETPRGRRSNKLLCVSATQVLHAACCVAQQMLPHFTISPPPPCHDVVFTCPWHSCRQFARANSESWCVQSSRSWTDGACARGCRSNAHIPRRVERAGLPRRPTIGHPHYVTVRWLLASPMLCCHELLICDLCAVEHVYVVEVTWHNAPK